MLRLIRLRYHPHFAFIASGRNNEKRSGGKIVTRKAEDDNAADAIFSHKLFRLFFVVTSKNVNRAYDKEVNHFRNFSDTFRCSAMVWNSQTAVTAFSFRDCSGCVSPAISSITSLTSCNSSKLTARQKKLLRRPSL